MSDGGRAIPCSIDVDQVPGLAALVDQAARAGEVELTRDGRAIARIVPVPPPASRSPRTPGTGRGMFWMADDFDATPQRFDEYF